MKPKKLIFGVDYIEFDDVKITTVDLSFSKRTTSPNMDDNEAWENFFHDLPTEQLEYFVCEYLGLSPKETIKVLELPGGWKHGNIRNKLRKMYRESKWLTK